MILYFSAINFIFTRKILHLALMSLEFLPSRIFNHLISYIYLAEFLKTYLKMGQNIRTESWR